MGLAPTLVGLAASLIVLAAALYWERRPKDPLRVRFVPTTAILFLAAVSALLFVVHLVNLAGVPTGR